MKNVFLSLVLLFCVQIVQAATSAPVMTSPLNNDTVDIGFYFNILSIPTGYHLEVEQALDTNFSLGLKKVTGIMDKTFVLANYSYFDSSCYYRARIIMGLDTGEWTSPRSISYSKKDIPKFYSAQKDGSILVSMRTGDEDKFEIVADTAKSFNSSFKEVYSVDDFPIGTSYERRIYITNVLFDKYTYFKIRAIRGIDTLAYSYLDSGKIDNRYSSVKRNSVLANVQTFAFVYNPGCIGYVIEMDESKYFNTSSLIRINRRIDSSISFKDTFRYNELCYLDKTYYWRYKVLYKHGSIKWRNNSSFDTRKYGPSMGFLYSLKPAITYKDAPYVYGMRLMVDTVAGFNSSYLIDTLLKPGNIYMDKYFHLEDLKEVSRNYHFRLRYETKDCVGPWRSKSTTNHGVWSSRAYPSQYIPTTQIVSPKYCGEKFYVQIDTSESFSTSFLLNKVLYYDPYNTDTVNLDLDFDKVYHIRCRAENDEFITPWYPYSFNSANDRGTFKPYNGTQLTRTYVACSLRSNGNDSTEGIIATDTNFTNIVFDTISLNGNNFDFGFYDLKFNKTYYMKVRNYYKGKVSKWSNFHSFHTMKEVGYASPNYGTIAYPTYFYWDRIFNTKGYIFKLDTSKNLTNPFVYSQLENNSDRYMRPDTAKPLLFNQKYYWKVGLLTDSDTLWSDTAYFTTRGPDKVITTKPEQDKTDVPWETILEWKKYNSLTTKYVVLYSKDSTLKNFNNLVVGGLKAIVKLDSSSTYYWKVNAINKDNSKISEDGIPSRFTTTGKYPRMTLYLPAKNAINVDLNQPLSWLSYSHVKEYEVQLSEESNFLNPIVRFTSSTNLTDPKFDLNKTFYWRVRAKDNNKYSDWSDTFKFTTTGVDNVNEIEKYGIQVFPNPFENSITISLNNSGFKPVSITSIDGKIIWTGEDEVETIQLSNLPAGFYFLNFSNGEIQIKHKLIKQN